MRWRPTPLLIVVLLSIACWVLAIVVVRKVLS
ncbi:hypothetical protein UFOVP143_38 [uncultured Caudovirales phage]|uniref:Uncharacterized protein n=1 Tax=uncultured Caudovirales phage TaxID=2100421 RepID=A0A6J7VPE1_9CAUD|nr:hypothetical protein UFOVP143_38 [uncultured Caudovirales phage]